MTIAKRDGTVLADSTDQAGRAGSPASCCSVLPNSGPSQSSIAVSGDILRVAGYMSPFRQGPYIIRLNSPLRDIEDTLHVVRTSLLWATLLALLLATLVSALLAHAVARRLARIVEFAHRLAGGDFSARIHENAKDEIAAVANALDATAIRVEAVFRELEDSRKEMETVLDSMEEAVIAVDAQSRIHWTNRVMVRLVGGPIQPGSALVQTVRDPDLLDCVEQALRMRVTANTRAKAVVPGRIFEVSAAPMLGGSAVVVLHDITEIDRVEKTRRDFIANVSHELRTPLTSISGYAETMLEEDGQLSPQTRDFLAIICRNAARMTRLTEDLLALARIESGEYKLNRRPVPAALLMDEAAAVMAGLLMDREHSARNRRDCAGKCDGGYGCHSAGAFEPARKCGEIRRRPADCDRFPGGSGTRLNFMCRTSARASPPNISGASSNVFTASIKAARESPAAPGWACRSPSTSFWPMAGPSAPKAI